jgi:signal transduction histidine kinase
LILQNRCKANASHPGITVLRDYGKLPAVECYAGQLNQVFMNILANAIDALEAQEQPQANPCIQIRTTALPNHWVVIQITDNGPGMSETVQQRLFDPFFTTKPVGQGVGLGLAISYQIVEKHGGRLKCHSLPGAGTEFTIEIPSATVYRIPAAIANRAPAHPPQSSPPRFQFNPTLPEATPAALLPAPLKTGNLTQVKISEPSIVSE